MGSVELICTAVLIQKLSQTIRILNFNVTAHTEPLGRSAWDSELASMIAALRLKEARATEAGTPKLLQLTLST